jgi:hypothetical protein
MFQTIVVEKIKTYMPSNFFFLENLAVYGIIRRHVVKPGRPQMTTWRMRIACCITKATNTHSQYAIIMASQLQQCSHERASILRYTYLVSLLSIVNSGTDTDIFSVLRKTLKRTFQALAY